MRVLLLKKTSTKAERIFAEILKRNRIPFEHRKKIEGREIDFIIGKYAVEIDGHDQDSARNRWLVLKGFVPVHYHNRLLRNDPRYVEESITKLLKN